MLDSPESAPCGGSPRGVLPGLMGRTGDRPGMVDESSGGQLVGLQSLAPAAGHGTALRPCRTRLTTTMRTSTSIMWIRPPPTGTTSQPSSHKRSRMRMSVSGVYRGTRVVLHCHAAAGPADHPDSPSRRNPWARHAMSQLNVSRRCSFNSSETPEVTCQPAIPGRPSWGPARGVVDLAPGRVGRAARRVDRVAHLPHRVVDLLTRPLGRALLAADQRQQPDQHEGENEQKISSDLGHPRYPA